MLMGKLVQMKTLNLFLAALMFLVVGNLQAQTEDVRLRFELGSRCEGGSSIVDHFVRGIAEGLNTSPSSISYTLGFKADKKLKKLGEKKFEVGLALQQFKLKGNLSYGQFPLKRILLPNTINVPLIVLDRSGNELLKVEFEDIAINENLDACNLPMQFKPIVLPVGSKPAHSIKIGEISFAYNSTKRSQFDKRIQGAKTYEGLEKKVRDLSHRLEGIKAKNPDLVEDNDRKIREIESSLGAINQKFRALDQGILRLDPVNLKGSIKNLELVLEQKKNRVKEILANRHIVYYDRGIKQLQNGRVHEAKLSFNKSLDFNKKFAPAHLELAKISFRNGNLERSEDILAHILNDLCPTGRTKSAAEDLSQQIFNGHLDRAQHLIQGGEFTNAIALLTTASGFSDRISFLNGGRDLLELFSAAHTGIYTEILKEASYDLRGGRLDRAHELLLEAGDYRSAKSDLVREDHQESLLMRDVQTAYYQKDILAGERALSNRRFKEAYQALENALSRESDYDLRTEPSLFALRKEAGTGYAYELLSKAQINADKNQLRSARENRNLIKKISSEFDLVQDQNFSSRLASLEETIFAQECRNAKTKYDDMLTQGGQLEQQGAFREAHQTYLKAVTLLDLNGDCGLSNDLAKAKASEIEKPAQFQTQMASAQGKGRSGNFALSLVELDRAKSFFELNSLSSFGLTVPSTQAFVKQSSNPRFKTYFASKLLSEGLPMQALEMVKLAIEQGVSKKEMKTLQLSLGAELAKLDRRETNFGHWKTLQRAYTNDSKDLKFIKKGYKRQSRSV